MVVIFCQFLPEWKSWPGQGPTTEVPGISPHRAHGYTLLFRKPDGSKSLQQHSLFRKKQLKKPHLHSIHGTQAIYCPPVSSHSFSPPGFRSAVSGVTGMTPSLCWLSCALSKKSTQLATTEIFLAKVQTRHDYKRTDTKVIFLFITSKSPA